MTRPRTNSAIFLFRVLALIFLPQVVVGLDERYNREKCLNKTTAILTNDPDLISLKPDVFFRGSTLADPLLTLKGCQSLCGSQWGFYPNALERLIQWIFPALLLIANLHFVPIGKKRYSIIVHLLGDPCDTLYRLLSTVEDWYECFLDSDNFIKDQESRPGGIVKPIKMQPQIITELISAATTRLIESLDAHKFSKRLHDKLDIDRVPLEELRDNYSAFCKAARALRRQRLHDIRRTGVAIMVYIIQVISVFLPQLGATSPSGGMISPSMLLVWLLPLVLLSNVGDYACFESARETLLEFLDVIGVELKDLLYPDTQEDVESAKMAKIPARPSELACSGAILHSHSHGRRRGRLRTAVLIFISVFPITLGCAAAFFSDYTAPTYFSCRATSIMAFYAAWLASSVMTRLILRFQASVGCRVWAFILLKDFIIATPILILILISTCGLYNSCFCSSGYIIRGSEAHVDLNPARFYSLNNSVIYPSVVSATIVLEMLIPVLVYGIQFQGFKAIWWDKSTEQVVAVMDRTPDNPDEREVAESENEHSARRRTM